MNSMNLTTLGRNTTAFLQNVKQIRCSSKIAVQLHKDVLNKLESEELKPRHHPGIQRIKKISLPENIQKGIIRCIGDYPVKSLVKDGQALSRYLNARHPPAEECEVRQKISEIEYEIDSKYPPPSIDEVDDKELTYYRNNRDFKIQKILKQRVMAWKSMNYGQYESLVYAIGRSAQEYAILLKIFTEIAHREPDFKPRNYFDFGSGVGTGMWAVSNLWKDTFFEYFNVDSSREMNDLSDMILRGGYENRESFLKNVYYRQFLPATDTQYDIVVSAFSLFELPNSQSRKNTILNLWKKCNGFLVLVEEGTRRAFELINEARDLLINLDTPNEIGHLYSPCPHNLPCPRLANLEDRTPCNFETHYEPVGSIGDSSVRSKHLYSYIVLKKGPRIENNAENWPRIIRPTIAKSKHAICRMCTANGNLREIIFTASKHGKYTYRCAKSSKWGDRLPIEIDKQFD